MKKTIIMLGLSVFLMGEGFAQDQKQTKSSKKPATSTKMSDESASKSSMKGMDHSKMDHSKMKPGAMKPKKDA